MFSIYIHVTELYKSLWMKIWSYGEKYFSFFRMSENQFLMFVHFDLWFLVNKVLFKVICEVILSQLSDQNDPVSYKLACAKLG